MTPPQDYSSKDHKIMKGILSTVIIFSATKETQNRLCDRAEKTHMTFCDTKYEFDGTIFLNKYCFTFFVDKKTGCRKKNVAQTPPA